MAISLLIGGYLRLEVQFDYAGLERRGVGGPGSGVME
jgi:hypothetical protein